MGRMEHLPLRSDVENAVVGELFRPGELGGRRRHQPPLVPGHADGREGFSASLAGREIVGDDCRDREGVEVARVPLEVGTVEGDPRFDRRRRAEGQRPHRVIDDVAAHVAEGPGAKIDPAAPRVGAVSRVVGTLGNGAEPEIPIEGGGDRRRAGGSADPLLPEAAGPIGPGVDFADVADDAGLDPFVREPRPFGGVPLVAHLRDHARPARRLGDGAGLPEGVGEGLLDVDVLAGGDGGHGGDGVGVIGGADGAGVDVLRLLVEHLPEVLVARRLGVGVEGAAGPLVVDITQRDDIRAELGEGGDVAPSHAAGTDAGEVDALTRRHVPFPPQHMAGHDHEAPGRSRSEGGGGGGALQEPAAAEPRAARRRRNGPLGSVAEWLGRLRRVRRSIDHAGSPPENSPEHFSALAPRYRDDAAGESPARLPTSAGAQTIAPPALPLMRTPPRCPPTQRRTFRPLPPATRGPSSAAS